MLPTWVMPVACVGLTIGCYALYERGNSIDARCKQEMADFKADLSKKALEQRVAVAEASATAARNALTETRQVEATASSEKERVRVVTVTLPCQNDPGINAMFDGLDRVLDPAAGPGADQGAGGRVPAGAVPRGGAAVPR